jgi:hypothetical protein
MVNVVSCPRWGLALPLLATAFVVAGLSIPTLSACTHHEPPAPEDDQASAAPEFDTASTSSSAPPAPDAGTVDASADPALLSQTREAPQAKGNVFETRVAALWQAIVADDPEVAMDFFFPLGAYEQVKDVGAPAADWKHRLVAAYARDIHALHSHLGNDVALARLIGLDVPEGRVRWVRPHEEYNKIGYFRVFGSKLRYDVDGTAHAFDVKSLISWRGQWYVVHLSAIK